MQLVNGKEVFTTLEELVNPKYTALLLIDIQNDYITRGGVWDKLGYSFELGRFIQNIKRVLESARHRNILTVHMKFTTHSDFMDESPAFLRSRLVRFRDESGSSKSKLVPYCVEGSWGWQIIDELAPLQNEIVLKKYRPSSFLGTPLDTILRSNDIKSLVIVGLVTHGCVLATAIDAQAHEYCPIILSDCVVSHKPRLHDAALLVMSGDKDVEDSKEIIRVWDKIGFPGK
jgi:nicotinamidase-related amidase